MATMPDAFRGEQNFQSSAGKSALKEVTIDS